jgi:protein-S-isoprenylcysteine O-methyltransferase Ste14
MRSAEQGSDRLPSLGRHGWGWLRIQQALIAAVIVCSTVGPHWPASVRTPLHVVGIAGLVLGGAMLIASVLSLGRSFRPLPEPLPGAELKQGYVYGLVRHPIYGAFTLLTLSAAVAFSPLALIPAMALIPVHIGKSMLEERWLTEVHPEYSDYRRRVRRRFLPGFF